jgi:hypothetical protein
MYHGVPWSTMEYRFSHVREWCVKTHVGKGYEPPSPPRYPQNDGSSCRLNSSSNGRGSPVGFGVHPLSAKRWSTGVAIGPSYGIACTITLPNTTRNASRYLLIFSVSCSFDPEPVLKTWRGRDKTQTYTTNTGACAHYTDFPPARGYQLRNRLMPDQAVHEPGVGLTAWPTFAIP